MFVEAVVVLGRSANHVRVTRALRPFFLVDTILLQDVRRCISCIYYTYILEQVMKAGGEGPRVHASNLQKCSYVVLLYTNI